MLAKVVSVVGGDDQQKIVPQPLRPEKVDELPQSIIEVSDFRVVEEPKVCQILARHFYSSSDEQFPVLIDRSHSCDREAQELLPEPSWRLIRVMGFVLMNVHEKRATGITFFSQPTLRFSIEHERFVVLYLLLENHSYPFGVCFKRFVDKIDIRVVEIVEKLEAPI